LHARSRLFMATLMGQSCWALVAQVLLVQLIVCRDAWILWFLWQFHVAQWRSTWRLWSQLGVEALKSHHGLHILGLDVSPCIIELVYVSFSLCFQNSNTSLCWTLCNSRIYVITLLFELCVCDVLLCNYYFCNDALWWSWWD
jgi:hypothetical protein